MMRAPGHFLLDRAGQSRARDHSHSIINRSRKPAWLEGLAVIDKEPYRRFYRQPYAAFVDVWRWSDLRGSGDF